MSSATTTPPGRHRTPGTRHRRRGFLAAALIVVGLVMPMTTANAATASRVAVALSAPYQQYGTSISAVAAATVNGKAAAGRVRYLFDGRLAAESRTDSSGRTRWVLQRSIAVGTHSMEVHFLPSAPGVSTSAIRTTVQVRRATPTISVAVPRSKPPFGSWTTMSMAVSAKNLGKASGRVTVSENGRYIGAATLVNGAAQVNFRLTSTPGNNVFTVSYAGSAGIAPASRGVQFATSRTQPTLTVSSASMGPAGGRASVKVGGGPRAATGTVTALVDGRTVATAKLSSGSASVTLPVQSVGRHTLKIRYSGDLRYTHAVVERSVQSTSNPCSASARACIDLTNNTSWIQEGGRIIYGPVPTTSGRPGYRTSTGMFSVYWKNIDHVSSIFNSAPMPYAIFFNGGEAFHEGSLYVTSHGCIHLSNAAARYYWNALDYGDAVHVFGYANY